MTSGKKTTQIVYYRTKVTRVLAAALTVIFCVASLFFMLSWVSLDALAVLLEKPLL